MSDATQASELQPVNYGWELNVLNWPLVVLSGLFMGTRVYLKIRQQRGLWWDDHFLILSWVSGTAMYMRSAAPVDA